MATFPSYVKLGWRDTAEQHTPVIARSEMERGIARQRRTHADSLVTVPVTAYFDTAAESLAFEGWFFSDAAAGAAWFDFTLPRTGALVQARVVGGDIGQLKPATKNWAFSERSFQLEYIRPSFVQLAPGLHSVDSSRILSVQRASAATYIDAAGVLQTAPANVARYQSGQLLVEGAGTNLLSYSSQFDNAAWVKASATVVSNVAAAPDGTMTADALIADATSAHHRIYRSIAAANNTPHWFSIFAKAYGVSRIQVSCGGTGLTGAGGSGADRLAVFNLTTGLVEGNHYGIQFVPLPNAWYRLAILLNTDSDGGGIAPYVAPVASAASGTYTGDGSSGVLIWGADCKVAELSSHIPTTTAAATRAADIITVAA